MRMQGGEANSATSWKRRAAGCTSLSFLGILSSCSSSPPESAQRDSPPHIVYILADDLGVGDVAYLNPDGRIPTPNLDRLGAAGVAFTDAHSGSAVCTPTRYGILTGRHSWRTQLQSGVLEGYSAPLIERDRMTVASLLKESGYRTACVGKWHLGWDWPTTDGEAVIESGAREGANVDYERPIRNGPRSLGFDHFFGIPASLDMVPYVFVEDERVLAAPTESMEIGQGQAFHRPGPAAPGFSHADVLPRCTAAAVALIDRHASEAPDSPLFLYFPLSAPHAPIVPSSEFVGQTGLGPYGDFVHQVDWSVGEILAALDRNGMSENSLVLFTADNGCAPGADFAHLASLGHHPSHVYRGRKADIFEGGHRVPFLARWEGRIAPGTWNDTPVCLTDLLATVADLLEFELSEDAGEDSVSMLPELLGRSSDGRPAGVIHHSINGSFAIRRERWKLILGPGSGGWSSPQPHRALMEGLPMVQLYDLESDVGERENLQAEHPEVVEELTALLESSVARGRSTPGEPRTNDVQPDLWKARTLAKENHRVVEVDHLARGRALTLLGEARPRYAEAGLAALTDGLRATVNYNDGHWLGFEGEDLQVVIDLGEPRELERVTAGFLGNQDVWVFHPAQVEVSLSLDGEHYARPQTTTLGEPTPTPGRHIRDVSFELSGTEARYVRLSARNTTTCPPWHKGEGGAAWVFADEILVD